MPTFTTNITPKFSFPRRANNPNDHVVTVYYQDPEMSESNRLVIAETIRQIATLYAAGYLPIGASVWFSPSDPFAGMWVLGERSTHVALQETTASGWCRVTKNMVRWAPTFADTSGAPLLKWTLDDVPTVAKELAHSTIIISHTGDKPMKFIRQVYKGKNESGENGTGRYEHGQFTIIDLPNYTPPEDMAIDSPYASAHAMLCGVELMTRGLSPELTEFIKQNVDVARHDLTEADLKNAVKPSMALKRWVLTQERDTVERLKANLIGGQNADGTSPVGKGDSPEITEPQSPQ